MCVISALFSQLQIEKRSCTFHEFSPTYMYATCKLARHDDSGKDGLTYLGLIKNRNLQEIFVETYDIVATALDNPLKTYKKIRDTCVDKTGPNSWY